MILNPLIYVYSIFIVLKVNAFDWLEKEIARNKYTGTLQARLSLIIGHGEQVSPAIERDVRRKPARALHRSLGLQSLLPAAATASRGRPLWRLRCRRTVRCSAASTLVDA